MHFNRVSMAGGQLETGASMGEAGVGPYNTPLFCGLPLLECLKALLFLLG